MKFVKILQNGVCVPVELDVKPNITHQGNSFPVLVSDRQSDASKWIVLTMADRISCFPHVKLSVESTKANGLFLFVSPLAKRTEENLFRKQLPFPLNIRLIYGHIIISFFKGHTEVLPMTIAQWQNVIEQWIGATTDQSIIHMHMNNRKFNSSDNFADEEKVNTSDMDDLLSDEDERYSDEDYEITLHNKEDYIESIPDDTYDVIPSTDVSDEDSVKEEMVEEEDDDDEEEVDDDDEF